MGNDDRPNDHSKRVHETFNSLNAQLGAKLDAKARESVEKLRSAAVEKDGAAVREHLTQVRESHGWLYRELVAHPTIAALLDELALLGL